MRLCCVGDVHTHFDEVDVRQIDAAGYDAVLFVGDLAGYVDDGRPAARHIARLQTPTLVLPGNHDAAPIPHLAAEIMGWSALRRVYERGQGRRCAALAEALGAVPLVGYSVHEVDDGAFAVTVIAARPHSFGGPQLAFRHHLGETHGVDSLEASAERLKRLVDEAAHEDLVFLAHNGPTGLGDRRHDIWGRDFRADEGDHGDPDLRAAIDHARDRGKRVRAVVAGHMHHALEGGGERIWQLERNGTLFVNAAKVPRVRRGRRHHVRLSLTPDHAEAVAVEQGAHVGPAE